jgi:FAD-dependent urate hydroxylase
MNLNQLNETVREDLERLNIGRESWLKPRTHADGHVYDVIIIGGGQSGLGTAFGLKRERINNVLILDENPAGQEGPWVTYARMVTLRTPKTLTSIDLGIPSLTFRAYWEARTGFDGWAAVDKIPRQDWMAYLKWYREVLNLPVANEVRVTRIEPLKDGLHRVHVTGAGVGGAAVKKPVLLARKVVLATGIQGGGEWHVPDMIAKNLPRHLYAHTSEAIDFSELKGKRIGILGGGASAFDNAQFALTEGVAEAHVFVRREQLPRINPIRHMEQAGLIERYYALSDADKYALMAEFFKHNQPPTNDTFARASAMEGFGLHLGAPWLKVEAPGTEVKVTTPKGEHRFDFVIISTGLITDPKLRGELNDVSEDILLWGDVYQAPEGVKNPLLDAHPHLKPDFSFKGRTPEAEAHLRGLFAFNYSALLSLGLSASALSGIRFAIPKLCAGIADQLFLDERDTMLEAFFAYKEEEFVGVWPPVAVSAGAAE